MSQSDRGAVWFAIGVGGAVALGVALAPLRTVVAASTCAFVFIALTIVVAEMGGRGPGLAAAVVSALSLNFFLTEPYLTLLIDKPGDLGAFLALAACGLVAAAFGKRRVRTAEQISRSRRDLDLLGRTTGRLATGAPIEAILEDLRSFFRLGGLVLRLADGQLVAAVPAAQAALPPPSTRLEPETLAPAAAGVHRLGWTGFRLPEGGGRLALGGPEPLVLDLWEGSPEGLTADERRTLAIAASVIALAGPIARGRPAAALDRPLVVPGPAASAP